MARPATRPALAPVRQLLAVLMAVVVGLAGCSGDNDDRADRADRPDGDASAEGEVTLVSSGSEPRRKLRIGVEKGDEITAVMTMGLGMTTKIDGKAAPVTPVPDTEMTMNVAVDDVSHAGDISFFVAYSSVEPLAKEGVDPAALDAIRSQLAELEGLEGMGVISPQSGLLDSSIDASTVKNDSLRATVESLDSQMTALTVPFPAEEVGQGASWRARRKASLNGVDTEMTMVYRLAKLDGDAYTLEVEQEITAPRGPVELPGLPSGTDATIDAYLVKTSGVIEGHLGRLLPIRSMLEGSGDITMQVTAGGAKRVLEQKLDLRSTLDEA